MSALDIGGNPVDVVVGGWEEDDLYVSQEASEGPARTIRSAVTDAREHDRAVRFRSIPLSRTDAATLEATLTDGPVNLDGDLPGAAVVAMAEDVVVEPWQGGALWAQVSCLFLINTPEEE